MSRTVADTRRRFMIHSMPFTNKETQEEVLVQVKDHCNDDIVLFTSSRKASDKHRLFFATKKVERLPP
jgi:hypothetical protein